MPYLNSVTIVGFVGADPEQRQARNNGSKFSVLSVATQRSWKNAEDEWVWLANCYFASRRACNIVTFCRRVARLQLVVADFKGVRAA